MHGDPVRDITEGKRQWNCMVERTNKKIVEKNEIFEVICLSKYHVLTDAIEATW